MKKRITAFSLAAAVICSAAGSLPVSAADPACRDIDPLAYTYEIYPLLEPFNEYFYVKTDNPHPESFRFADHDSPYSETSVIYNTDTVYADVEYEDESVWRVNGGYIFKSYTTNGGEVTLQVQESITRSEFNTAVYGTPDPEFTGYSPYHGMPVGSYDQHFENSSSYRILGYFKWVDTDVKLTLPPLCDDCDYLIQTYAGGDDFFSDMDAVQSGFSSICLYSGSFIRGELYRSGSRDWRLSPAGHIDQIFYIYSPYSRKDNKSLFASAIYPYRYDSLGFPGMMGSVSKRLNPDSTYTWSDSSHAYIAVTLGDQTKSYGGAGSGEGQGISEDKLSRIFRFGEQDESTTLSDAKALLREYADVEMDDDIPRDDAVTWERIYNTVGDGAWVDMGGIYTYLYQKNADAYFNADEWGVGHSIYWGGSLGYASDMWVDGRYISNREYVISGQTFADHPTSAILVPETEVPLITDYTSQWDSENKCRIYTSAEAELSTQKNVIYRYDAASGLWKANVSWGKSGISFSVIEAMAQQGVIDASYYDRLILTPEQAEALVSSGNTNTPPQKGFYFDGNEPQGTPFFKGDVNDDGAVTVADAVMLQKYLLTEGELTNRKNADLNADGKLSAADLTFLKRILLKG
ncbi:MAG: dockerin type I repeat-containing protein [Oscillospiraceae bacterium]|nr:dockerin type I repeat-containing protein [Oscillospiraceae bacterium]